VRIGAPGVLKGCTVGWRRHTRKRRMRGECLVVLKGRWK
jgi:hypothetical protein